MYTNIDNGQELDALRNVFQANPSPRRSDKHILELSKLSLKNNNFEFNNETFLQIQLLQCVRNSNPAKQIYSWHNGKM